MKFSVGQTWVARDGSKWRILATDCPYIYVGRRQPIVAMKLSYGTTSNLSEDGRFERADHVYDLIHEHREPREWTMQANRMNIGQSLHIVAGTWLEHDETVRVREVFPEDKA